MSNILSETPTVDTTESHIQKPTWEVRIGGSPDARAVLARVTESYGPSPSSAIFSINEDPDTGTFPAYNSPVEVDINGLNIFKGKIKGITSRISISGLNKTFTALSNLTELTEKVVDSKTQSEFNGPTVEEIDRLNVAQILTEILGYTPAGSPTDDPGNVTVRDMTQLDAVQTVVNKVGNYKLFWNKDTNLVEIYRFGQGGNVSRRFEKGVNLIDSAITENEQSRVDKLTLVGAATAIRKRKFVDTNLDRDENGVYKQSFTITGKNIRDVKVEGQYRDRPLIEFDGKLQLLPADMGIIALSTTKETGEEINENIADLTVELETVVNNPQFDTQESLQREAAGIQDEITSEQGKLESLFAAWPFFPFSEFGNARRDIGFRPAVTKLTFSPTQFAVIGTSIEYDRPNDTIRAFLSNVPQVYFSQTISSNVPKERLGVTSGGFATGDFVTVRVLTRVEWARGAVRVTYTEDGDCPQIVNGSGTVERTITDAQYQIVQNSIDVTPAFDNESEVLELMQTRADAEFEKVNRPSIGGSLTVLGDETLELKSTIVVNGTKLDVVSITHDLVQGYTTSAAVTNEPFIALTAARAPVLERRRQKEQGAGTEIRLTFDEVEIDQDKTTQRQIEFQRRLEEAGISFASYQD